MLPGTVCSASMWCKADAYGGAYGNDTHSLRLRMRFNDMDGNNLGAFTANSAEPDNTWQQLVISDQVAPPNAASVRLLFFYITTQPANAWKVWNIDDLVLDMPNGDQQVIFDILPVVTADNLSNTSATITGARLSGVSTVKLVQGATELVGGNIVVAGDGKSLTVDFPTTGAPYGDYQVIVEKPGYAPAFLNDAFRIRDPGGSWLVNGDFETGDLSGWEIWQNDSWGGTPAIENVYVGDAGDLFIHVPEVNGVDTPVFGQYSLRIGEYQENGGEGGVYQLVPVLGNEELSLAWKWGGGNTVSPSAVEVAVLKGAFTQGWSYLPEDVLGIYRLDDPGTFGWEDGSLSFTVPANEDTITVYAKTWHNPAPEWNYVALWLDEMTLTLPDCPAQHELASIDPASGDANSEFDLTVYGTNMDQVTAIRLVRGLDQIVGSISSASGGSLTAHFVPPTEGATLGDYDVVTEQAGMYKLVGVRNDTCGSPSDLPGAFEMVLPDGDNALANGDFETGVIDPWVLTPDSGDTQKGEPIPGAELAYTQYVDEGDPANIGFPQVQGISTPYSGDEVLFTYEGNYGVGLYSFEFESDPPGPYDPDLEYATWLSPNGGKLAQSIGLPKGPGEYELVLTYWVRFWDEAWPHTSLTATILIDGAPASSVTAAFPGHGQATQDEFDPYTQLSVDYLGPVSTDISVEFDFQSDFDEGGSYSGATAAIMVDDVRLFGIVGCPDPFADSDGDGDVDQADFSRLQQCYTGEGTFALADECECFDHDQDDDVDPASLAAFELCANGPAIAADPACDD